MKTTEMTKYRRKPTEIKVVMFDEYKIQDSIDSIKELVGKGFIRAYWKYIESKFSLHVEIEGYLHDAFNIPYGDYFCKVGFEFEQMAAIDLETKYDKIADEPDRNVVCPTYDIVSEGYNPDDCKPDKNIVLPTYDRVTEG